jgi:hypothetical protein
LRAWIAFTAFENATSLAIFVGAGMITSRADGA